MYFIYNMLIYTALFVIVPFFIFRMWREEGFSIRLRQSFGFLREEDIKAVAGKRCIWIHGASVGEIVATSPLVKEFRADFPDIPILVSAVTTGGYLMAKQIIPEANSIIYFPLDVNIISAKVIDQIKPRIFLPVETELWPNFLKIIAKRNIPVMMVNGRISDKSVKSYRYLFNILADMLNTVDRFCMQSTLDAEYIIQLGAEPKRVVVTGNTKFDQTYAEVTNSDRQKYLAELGLSNNAPIIVAGSTHPTEEESLFVVFKDTLEKFPDARLIIAPRKTLRVHEIASLAKNHGYTVGFRKELLEMPEPRQSYQVIIIDTIGELGRIYALGDLVFVGGSMIKHGGHNVLEPAAHGKPIVVGQHMYNFKDAYALLTSKGACKTIKNVEELKTVILDILSDDDLRKSMSAGSSAVIAENKGAAVKTSAYLKQILAGSTIYGKSINYAVNDVSSSHHTIKGGERARQKEAIELYLYRLVHGKIQNIGDLLILAVLRVASLLYELGVRTKLTLYSCGVFSQHKLSAVVISLGNITVGGTGKTPTAQKIARMIKDLGYNVVILNRGYRAHWDGDIGVVSDGKKIFMTAFEAGDEAYLLAKTLPGIPVVIGKDRAITGEYVVSELNAEVVILDDAYQHWQLARNLDIVLIDTLNIFGNGFLLPRGTLREPLSHLDRAQIFLLTKTDQSSQGVRDKIKETLRDNNPKAIIVESNHKPQYFLEIADWYKGLKGNSMTLDTFQGVKVMAFSAIGNPASFEQTLAALGVDLVETIRYPDHHEYGMVEMQYVLERAVRENVQALVTTDKDAVKIPTEFIYFDREMPLYVLCIEVQINEDEAFNNAIIETIKKGINK